MKATEHTVTTADEINEIVCEAGNLGNEYNGGRLNQNNHPTFICAVETAQDEIFFFAESAEEVGKIWDALW